MNEYNFVMHFSKSIKATDYEQACKFIKEKTNYINENLNFCLDSSTDVSLYEEE